MAERSRARRPVLLPAILCYGTPPFTAALSCAIVYGLPQPPPVNPLGRAAVLSAVCLNVILSVAGPAYGGLLSRGPLAARVGRALAYGGIGLAAHFAFIFIISFALFLVRGV